MSSQRNITIAQKLLEGIGSTQDPAEIAALFDADLVFEIQGDDGALPWIGRKTGSQAVADFICDMRALTEPVTFDVEDILQATAAPRSLVRSRPGSRRPARSPRRSSQLS
jgi:ketosteroid isomerase-like protein